MHIALLCVRRNAITRKRSSSMFEAKIQTLRPTHLALVANRRVWVGRHAGALGPAAHQRAGARSQTGSRHRGACVQVAAAGQRGGALLLLCAAEVAVVVVLLLHLLANQDEPVQGDRGREATAAFSKATGSATVANL